MDEKPWEQYDSYSDWLEDNPDEAPPMESRHFNEDDYWVHSIVIPVPDSPVIEREIQGKILVYVIVGFSQDGGPAPHPIIISHTSDGIRGIKRHIHDVVHGSREFEWTHLFVFEERGKNSINTGIAESIENHLWEAIDPKYHHFRQSGSIVTPLSESEKAVAERYAEAARTHLDLLGVDAFCEYRKDEDCL